MKGDGTGIPESSNFIQGRGPIDPTVFIITRSIAVTFKSILDFFFLPPFAALYPITIRDVFIGKHDTLSSVPIVVVNLIV